MASFALFITALKLRSKIADSKVNDDTYGFEGSCSLRRGQETATKSHRQKVDGAHSILLSHILALL